MSNYHRLSLLEIPNQSKHVFYQGFDLVVLSPWRFIAEVVAAQIGCDCVEFFSDYRKLMTPGIPKLGKAMQQDHQIVAAAAFSVMQANVLELGKVLSNGKRGHWSRRIHCWSGQPQPHIPLLRSLTG